jgi:hypothetical protein
LSLFSVIHGYVQSAATVAANTVPLREELADIANLHYVDGPPMHSAGGSRPWWILGRKLEHDLSNTRWQETVSTSFFSEPRHSLREYIACCRIHRCSGGRTNCQKISTTVSSDSLKGLQ